MTEQIKISVVRADELDESTRDWCFSLFQQNARQCRSEPSAEDEAETFEALSNPANGVLLATVYIKTEEDAGSEPEDIVLKAPKLPVVHEGEEPPNKKHKNEQKNAQTKVSDDLAGFLLYDFDDIEMEPDEGFCAYNLEVHVSPKNRKKGIGAALLSALERIAIEAGASCLKLTCSKKNEGALHFYDSHGFVLDPDNPDDSFHVDYVILRKPLLKTKEQTAKEQLKKTPLK